NIQHVTDLTVNKKGIEGAAVTVIKGAMSSRPAEIKLDFVIDKAFGFIITDRDNVTLFSGVVNKI
ncbi:MAG: serpin family protein, partial [Clostridia bacterium]|nr:serpin family protein [Clostridia bacterium]